MLIPFSYFRKSLSFVIVTILSLQVLFATGIEPTVKSLDTTWENRDKQFSEIVGFLNTTAKEKKKIEDYDVLWRVLRMYYYTSGFATEQEIPRKKMADFLEYAIVLGKKTIEKFPNKVEGHYWHAVNLGLHGLANGIMKSLGNKDAMFESLNKAIKIDPNYHVGGPYRVRGRLYFKLPGLVGGSNSKALADLKEAKKIGKDCRLNHVYFAQVAADELDEEDVAKSLIVAYKAPSIMGSREEADYKGQMVSTLLDYYDDGDVSKNNQQELLKILKIYAKDTDIRGDVRQKIEKELR